MTPAPPADRPAHPAEPLSSREAAQSILFTSVRQFIYPGSLLHGRAS
jgi:hypothetical protein